MSVTSSIAGLAGLRQMLETLPEAAEAEIADRLGEIADDVVAEAKRSLGRLSPSAPGDPPADPAGALAASLRATVDRDALTASITAADRQASFLEYGTRRIAARPFLRPAILATATSARAKMKAALARAMTAFGGSS